MPKIIFLADQTSFLARFLAKHFMERMDGMKKKSYKGSRCVKRSMSKCADGVARTYNAIEAKYAEKLEENPDVKEFRCQVLLEGLEIGEYCSDFVATKMDGDLMVRECVFRKHLTKPMTAKLLDASRNYWRRRGVTDWGIVVEKKEAADGEESIAQVSGDHI